MTEETLAERVEQALADAHRASARAKRAAVELEELRGHGRSGHGEVRVEVDHRGLLQDVTLQPSAMALEPGALREAVLASIAAAGADLRSQAAEITKDIHPDPRPLAEQTEMFDVAERLMRGGA